jgi:hypothetical protein
MLDLFENDKPPPYIRITYLEMGQRTNRKKLTMEESSKSRGANYRTHEDVALCSAWLEATCDPICGIYQSGGDFYEVRV